MVDVAKRGSAPKFGSQARVVMARRSGKVAEGCSGLRGWRPAGAKRIWSRAKVSAAAAATARWPWWMGSNVPPKSAMRMMDLEQFFELAEPKKQLQIQKRNTGVLPHSLRSGSE